MNRAWLDLLKARFREEILKPRIAEFRNKLEYLRNEPLEASIEVISALISDAHLEFRELLELPPGHPMGLEINQLFYGHLVSGFNSVMPEDYPYIIGIGNIRDEKRICFVYLYRDVIREMFPELKPTSIPIVLVERADNFAMGNFTEMEIAHHPDDIRIVPFDE